MTLSACIFILSLASVPSLYLAAFGPLFLEVDREGVVSTVLIKLLRSLDMSDAYIKMGLSAWHR